MPESWDGERNGWMCCTREKEWEWIEWEFTIQSNIEGHKNSGSTPKLLPSFLSNAIWVPLRVAHNAETTQIKFSKQNLINFPTATMTGKDMCAHFVFQLDILVKNAIFNNWSVCFDTINDSFVLNGKHDEWFSNQIDIYLS